MASSSSPPVPLVPSQSLASVPLRDPAPSAGPVPSPAPSCFGCLAVHEIFNYSCFKLFLPWFLGGRAPPVPQGTLWTSECLFFLSQPFLVLLEGDPAHWDSCPHTCSLVWFIARYNCDSYADNASPDLSPLIHISWRSRSSHGCLISLKPTMSRDEFLSPLGLSGYKQQGETDPDWPVHRIMHK